MAGHWQRHLPCSTMRDRQKGAGCTFTGALAIDRESIGQKLLEREFQQWCAKQSSRGALREMVQWELLISVLFIVGHVTTSDRIDS
jgi:hypothetical protein